jgi:streptogramin lyase
VRHADFGTPACGTGWITRIVFDQRGRVWTLNLRSRFGFVDGRSFKVLTPDNSGLCGVPGALAADRRGRIWVATSDAVCVIDSAVIR